MGKDTAEFNARSYSEFLETGVFPHRDETVLAVMKTAGCELKREEIIKRFQVEMACEDLDVDEIVSGALTSLVKNIKIERTRTGYYQVL